jgi:hypothetical protein
MIADAVPKLTAMPTPILSPMSMSSAYVWMLGREVDIAMKHRVAPVSSLVLQRWAGRDCNCGEAKLVFLQLYSPMRAVLYRQEASRLPLTSLVTKMNAIAHVMPCIGECAGSRELLFRSAMDCTTHLNADAQVAARVSELSICRRCPITRRQLLEWAACIGDSVLLD